MSTGTTSTTVTANWTVVADANGSPTVVSGDDVQVFVNNDTAPFSGEAWSDIDTMDAIPAGATITDVTFSLGVQVDGSRDSPSIAVAPQLQFIDKAQYLADSYINGFGSFGAGGVGDLPDDNSAHDIAYVNSVYRVAEPFGGIADVDAFAAALSNASTPVILRAGGPNGGATGTGITYSAPLTITFAYETADVVTLDCDTDTGMDLSSATFLTFPSSGTPGPYGQYSDDVIWPVADAGGTGIDGAPDFYFAGLTLDATKKHRVTVTFDPDSAHDSGGRRFWLTGLRGGDEETSYQDDDYTLGNLYNGSLNIADEVTVIIGPGIGGWDDATFGVAAGFDGLFFETDNTGAVSAITVRKICNDDLTPTAPTDGSGEGSPGAPPDPASGDPSAPLPPGDAPANLPVGDGFLDPANRRGAPTRVEVVVDGHWLTTECAWGEPAWSHVWPGGSGNASWTAANTPKLLTRRGLLVQLFYGGECIWSGPQTDEGNAVGLWSVGQNYAALDSSGDATNVPDTAIDAAIVRGLKWKRRTSISSAAANVDISQGPVTIGALLDAYATDATKRWGVDPDGYVYAVADPTSPAAVVLPLDEDLAPGDEDFATALVGRYYNGTDYATAVVSDAASEALNDYHEETVDLTGRGTLTSTKADNILTAILNLGKSKPTWASPLVLGYGDLLTPGGTPMGLELFTAGQIVRVLGVNDAQNLGGLTYVDLLIGESQISDDQLTLTPIGAPARDLMDLLATIPKKGAA